MRIFALAFFTETGQWPQPQSQNRRSKLKTGFVFDKKGPIRVRPKRHIHFLKMLKAKLLKSGNKQKNSARVDTFLGWAK